MLILKRIRVVYQLRAPASERETIERVLETHARHCPVARSLEGAIPITTEVQLQEEG